MIYYDVSIINSNNIINAICLEKNLSSKFNTKNKINYLKISKKNNIMKYILSDIG